MKDKLYEFFCMFLFIVVIILSIKIFDNNYYFDFNKMNIGQIFTNNLNFNHLFSKDKEKNVNNYISYLKIDNKYTSTSNYIYALEDSLIKEVSENKIVLYQNNEYYLIYEGVFEIFINSNDYVEKNKIIAIYFDAFNLYFIKDNMIVLYEEYI